MNAFSIHPFFLFPRNFHARGFYFKYIYIFRAREEIHLDGLGVEGTCREMYVMFSAYRSSIKLTDYFIPGGWNDSACNVG